jgi:hypothetical protein
MEIGEGKDCSMFYLLPAAFCSLQLGHGEADDCSVWFA